MKGLRARLWLDGRFRRGWLLWEQGKISGLGLGRPPRRWAGRLRDLDEQRVVPGFVDALMHGCAGVDASTGSPAALDRMTRALAAAGVTTVFPGIYPAALRGLRGCARRWSKWKAMRGRVRAQVPGWHLEGPFLAPEMAGALPARALRRPSSSAARRLIEACGGWLALCTLAPELPGALEAGMAFSEAGVLPSIGHTSAGFADCAALAALGPLAMTHLGNRCLPLRAREPGPIGFALSGRADWVTVIPDGVHLAPRTLKLLAHASTLDEALCGVSDSLSATGTGQGRFRSGGLPLEARNGVARTPSGGLAGSLRTLPEMLRARVVAGDLSWAEALRVGCENPGRLLGDRGILAVGYRADLAALDGAGRVDAVWVGGRRAQFPAEDR